MYSVRYVLGTTSPDLASRFFGILFECLIRVNVLILRAYPDLRLAGVERGERTPGHLRSALEVAKDGRGSPLDLAAIECARRRIAGQEGATIRAVFSGVPPSVRFYTGAFRGDFERDLSNAILAELLEALVKMDVLCFETYPQLPGIYASGVYYQREPRGEENWQTVLALYRQGFGDCEDLASGLTAEKRVRQGRAGVRAGFFYRKRPDGGTLYHIQQMSESGRLEDDPSARLGMMEKDL